MVRFFCLLLTLILLGCGGGGESDSVVTDTPGNTTSTTSQSKFVLFSKTLGFLTDVPSNISATAGNVSLGFTWLHAPGGTMSYCVILEDPDVPGSTAFIHWNIFNIPRTVTEIAENASGSAMPEGSVEGSNGTNAGGYYGPNPPDGEVHRYSARIYAMNVETIDVTSNSSYTQDTFSATYAGSILESTALTFVFSR